MNKVVLWQYFYTAFFKTNFYGYTPTFRCFGAHGLRSGMDWRFD